MNITLLNSFDSVYHFSYLNIFLVSNEMMKSIKALIGTVFSRSARAVNTSKL